MAATNNLFGSQTSFGFAGQKPAAGTIGFGMGTTGTGIDHNKNKNAFLNSASGVQNPGKSLFEKPQNQS